MKYVDRQRARLQSSGAPPSQMSSTTSPSFRRPPVVETVLSVQFEPLPKFQNAHLGAFWKSLGKEWPIAEDASLLPQERERFGNDQIWQLLGSVNFQVAQIAPTRLRIKNGAGDRIIQLQHNRLTYNWVSDNPESTEYPRYRSIKPEFEKMLSRLNAFLAAEGLGAVQPNQWEVVYVNHIRAGTVWDTPADWHRIFRAGMAGLARITGDVVLQSVGGTWTYEICPQLGRLHVGLQHAWIGERKGPESLILQLTARGPLPAASAQEDAVSAGLDIGHRAIVYGFADLTSDEAHKFWEREQ